MEFERGDFVKPSQHAVDRRVIRSPDWRGRVIGFGRYLTMDGRKIVRVHWDHQSIGNVHGYHPNFIEKAADEER